MDAASFFSLAASFFRHMFKEKRRKIWLAERRRCPPPSVTGSPESIYAKRKVAQRLRAALDKGVSMESGLSKCLQWAVDDPSVLLEPLLDIPEVSLSQA